MNKRELAVRDFLMERFISEDFQYAIPVKIIVEEDKKNDRFIMYEIWDSNEPNKPFVVFKPILPKIESLLNASS